MKKIWAVITAILAIGVVTFTSHPQTAEAAKNPSSVEAIKKRGKLKVAVFGDLSPYGYLDKDGKNQGYDIYLAKRLAKDLLGDESKIEFVVVNAEERVDALKSNKVDIVLANFTKTPEREKVVDFASPYMKVGIGVVSPKDKAITKASQLNDKKLIVTKGTTAETYFAKKYPDINLEKYESKSQQFQALTDGRAAALADDNTYLYAWVKENPDYEVGIKEIGEVSTINPGIKKGNKSLLKWVNKDLKKLKKADFFEEAYDQTLKPFFGSDIKATDVIITK
ncbi:MAG: transporter substrate-binding domain-containing protein [Enterococcus sp.]|uniref:transporter substrate-binding domain-containing protein n=1 Tax=Enterococcus TaxID=1350 RepID=UPI002FC9F7F0